MGNTKQTVRKYYIKYLRNRIKNPMVLHRLKMMYFATQYRYIFSGNIPKYKWTILWKFIKIDFGILHAHEPIDFLIIAKRILQSSGEGAIIEAGCWNGGSSAKLSILAHLTGRKLMIYDSFEGVEPIGAENEKTHDFSYEYASPMENTKRNIDKWGKLDVCSFHKGYFEHSFVNYNTPYFLCYIDCDLAKGTDEVMTAILPYSLSESYIFSQDYAINAVRVFLDNETYFNALSEKNNMVYNRTPYTRELIEFKFNRKNPA